MKIFNIIKYRFLYIFTICFAMFWSKPAYAGWFGDLVDDIKQKAKEVSASLLGVDISDNCKVPSFVTGDADTNVNCLFCNMFKAIFNAGSVVAGKAYNSFKGDLGELLLVFIAVSLALIVIKNLSSFGGTDTASIMNNILQKIFVGAVIYLIISDEYYSIMNLTIIPLYKSGLGLFTTESCGHAAGIIGFSDTFVVGEGSSLSGGLPTSLGASIVCTINSLESKVSTLFDLGDWAFCRGLGPDRIFIILPNIVHLIDGVLFYLCGLVLMVMYPWVLADAVFQLVLSFSLLPFAVCGYAFEGTKKYFSKVFTWILNSLIVFIFMHILLLCLNEYLKSIILEALENSGGDAKVLFTHPTKGIAFYGIGAVKIVFIVYIIYIYIPIVKDLGGKFADGAGLNAGAGIDTFMRKQLNKQGNKVGEKALQGAKNTLEWGGNRVKGLSRRGMMKVAGATGGIRIPFNGKYRTHNVGGKQYLEREKTRLFGGRKERKLYDDFSVITIKYDRHGNEIGRHVEFRDSFAKEGLIDSKGRIDKNAYKALMSSDLGSNPAYKKMIMEQIAINALEAKGKKVGKYFSSRNVTYNVADPYSIIIDQVDHNGRVTKVHMRIDPTTGQVALAHATKRVDNKILRRQGVSTKKESIIQNRRRERNIDNIKTKLNGANHADGLFYSYDKVTDADGVEHYQKRLRGIWNLKNYFRTGKNVLGTATDNSLRAVGVAADLPAGIIATGGLVVESLFFKKSRTRFKNKFINIKNEAVDIPGKEASRYSSDWHTGDVRDYSSKGYIKTDSVTGSVEKRKAADATVITAKDGSRQYIDNSTGGVFANEGLSGEFELFFTNGDMEFTTNGVMGKDGILTSEVSKFKYGAHIQKGHDSVLERTSGYQVVDENGVVASDVSERRLFFGVDEMFGKPRIHGTATKDYIKDNILVEGRKRRTNRVRTNFGMSIF